MLAGIVPILVTLNMKCRLSRCWCGGGAGAGAGAGYAASHRTLLHIETLNKTEVPVFILFFFFSKATFQNFIVEE